MRAFLVAELQIITGRPPFAVATCVHVALLTGFLVAWGDPSGVPTLLPRSLYEQFRLVEIAALALVLPWVVCRCGACERRSDLAALAAMLAISPLAVVTARLCAWSAALALVAFAGFPPAILAWRMSPDPGGLLIADQGLTMAAAILAASVAMVWQDAGIGRFPAWAATTCTATAAVAIAVGTASRPTAAPVLLALSGLIGVWLMRRAGRTLLYAEDSPA